MYSEECLIAETFFNVSTILNTLHLLYLIMLFREKYRIIVIFTQSNLFSLDLCQIGSYVLLDDTLHCDVNPYLGYKLCYCKVNGEVVPMNGTLCTDLNECDVHNGGCEHICENTLGSFVCTCRTGFNISENGLSCDG